MCDVYGFIALLLSLVVVLYVAFLTHKAKKGLGMNNIVNNWRHSIIEVREDILRDLSLLVESLTVDEASMQHKDRVYFLSNEVMRSSALHGDLNVGSFFDSTRFVSLSPNTLEEVLMLIEDKRFSNVLKTLLYLIVVSNELKYAVAELNEWTPTVTQSLKELVHQRGFALDWDLKAPTKGLAAYKECWKGL